MFINNDVRLIGRIVESDLPKKIQNPQNKLNGEILYFKLAVKRIYNKQDHTQFIPLKAFGKMAKKIAVNYNKGDLVAIQAQIHYQNKENADGEWEHYWSIVVININRLQRNAKNDSTTNNQQNLAEEKIQSLPAVNNHLDEELAQELTNDNDATGERSWELDL